MGVHDHIIEQKLADYGHASSRLPDRSTVSTSGKINSRHPVTSGPTIGTRSSIEAQPCWLRSIKLVNSPISSSHWVRRSNIARCICCPE